MTTSTFTSEPFDLIDKFYFSPIDSGLTIDECLRLLSHCAMMPQTPDIRQFTEAINIRYDCDFKLDKPWRNPKEVFHTKAYQCLQEHRRFVETEHKNIVIAKRYFNELLNEGLNNPIIVYAHMTNLCYLYFIRRDFDLVFKYFPKVINFTYVQGHCRSSIFVFQMTALLQSLEIAIDKLSTLLYNDIFVKAICQVENIPLKIKIQEIIVAQMTRLRTHLISANYTRFKDFIGNKLDPKIVRLYSFIHHNERRHLKILDIINIIKGNDIAYMKRQVYLALHQNEDRANFADLIHHFTKTDDPINEDILWSILPQNMDKIVKLRDHKMGTICLTKLVLKLDKITVKKDARYQWVLQMKKLLINPNYKWLYKTEPAYHLKICYRNETKSECLCCFEEFQRLSSIVAVCSTCESSYCWNCCTRLFIHGAYKCAHCRVSGRLQQSITFLNLPVN
ncbi:MAG: hypothetical protein ACK518_03130 [bacterium]